MPLISLLSSKVIFRSNCVYVPKLSLCNFALTTRPLAQFSSREKKKLNFLQTCRFLTVTFVAEKRDVYYTFFCMLLCNVCSYRRTLWLPKANMSPAAFLAKLLMSTPTTQLSIFTKKKQTKKSHAFPHSLFSMSVSIVDCVCACLYISCVKI